MNAYMVFAGRKWENVLGKAGINWTHENSILGVFHAPTAEDACKAAAIKAGFAGTFFAVEGTPWGIDMYESEVEEYGAPKDPAASRLDRLEAALMRGMDRLATALPAPAEDDGEEPDLDPDDD